MSSLTRYPVPQAIPAGGVVGPRLHFRLEPTVVPAPVLDFLQPLRAKEQGIAAGKVDDPRLYFRLQPLPALEFHPGPEVGSSQPEDGGNTVFRHRFVLV